MAVGLSTCGGWQPTAMCWWCLIDKMDGNRQHFGRLTMLGQ